MNSRLLNILKLYDDAAPLAEAHTIPAPWYTDPEVESLERSHVFGGGWQAIGRTDQVSGPGDYFTTELAGEPILAVRGTDGILRAFYNFADIMPRRWRPNPAGTRSLFAAPITAGTMGSTAA